MCEAARVAHFWTPPGRVQLGSALGSGSRAQWIAFDFARELSYAKGHDANGGRGKAEERGGLDSRRSVKSPGFAGLRVAAAFAVSLALFACGGSDEDRIWDVGERRQVFTNLARLPSVSAQVAKGWFEVLVPLGLNRTKLTLAANDSLVLEPGVTVIKPSLAVQLAHYGVVSSVRNIEIAHDTKLGIVYALGNTGPRIEPGANVSGYVRAAGLADRIGNGTVGLGVMENAGVFIEGFGWQVDFPPHNRGTRVSRADDAKLLSLEPGAYEELTVSAGSSAAIRSGTYYFERLKVEPRGTLEIANTDGPVYVWVRDALELHGTMLDYSIEANVLFGYAGSKPVTSRSFRGTLVAPAAAVRLQASSTAHSGAFYAREIRVESGAMVEQRTFPISPRELPSSALVCNRCALSAQRHARGCCAELNRSRSVLRDAEERCVLACQDGQAGPPGHCRASCSAWSEDGELGASAAFQQCVHSATSLYLDCELGNNYRPDTCLNSGFPDFGVETCGL